MTKEKALYQVKLVLDNLNEEDYNLIRKEDLDYVYNNMEYDENIKIDTNLPFEKLNLDPKAYDVLERIISNAEIIQNQNISNENIETDTKYVELEKKYELQINKNEEMKKMIIEYKELVDKKDEELNRQSENNMQLYNSIKKCPYLIRKIFFREFEKKLLK